MRLTPLKAIRKHCLWCMDNSSKLVRECEAEDLCSLWPLRLGKAVKGCRPLKLIRAKCLECVETSNQVKECSGKMVNGVCPLHCYRFGRTGRKASQIQQEQSQKALKIARHKALNASNSAPEL